MIRVGKLLEELEVFPEDYWVFAYEGEDCGLVIVNRDRKQVGFVEANEVWWGD